MFRINNSRLATLIFYKSGLLLQKTKLILALGLRKYRGLGEDIFLRYLTLKKFIRAVLI